MIVIETTATVCIFDMVLYGFKVDGSPGTMRTGPFVLAAGTPRMPQQRCHRDRWRDHNLFCLPVSNLPKQSSLWCPLQYPRRHEGPCRDQPREFRLQNRMMQASLVRRPVMKSTRYWGDRNALHRVYCVAHEEIAKTRSHPVPIIYILTVMNYDSP